jgi:hypothetical protein
MWTKQYQNGLCPSTHPCPHGGSNSFCVATTNGVKFRNLQTFGRFLKSGLYNIYIYVYWMYLLIVYIYMYTISIWLYLDTFGCCFGTLFESFERPLSIYELIPVGKMPLAALCSGKMELAILLLATCSCEMLIYSLPSGKLTVCYWKWPFIVDLRIKHCDFP